MEVEHRIKDGCEVPSHVAPHLWKQGFSIKRHQVETGGFTALYFPLLRGGNLASIAAVLATTFRRDEDASTEKNRVELQGRE